MGMFDTVRHDGHEWQTKSIDPAMGGRMDEYEVKDGRLWHFPSHLEETGVEVPEPGPEAGFMAWMDAHHAKYRRGDDPPVDVAFHGVLDIHRTMPERGEEGEYRFEYRRLVFAFGQLVSEAPKVEETDSREGCALWERWLPAREPERMAWKLHALSGLLTGLAGDEAMRRAGAEESLAAVQEAAEALRRAVAAWKCAPNPDELTIKTENQN